MDKDIPLTKELLAILFKAVDNEIYGSVEIYFEKGQVTQITQRIINKVPQPKQPRSIANRITLPKQK